MYVLEEVKEALKEKISEIVNAKESEISFEIPPKEEFGDISFPCFMISKKLKKPPNEIAARIAEKFGSYEYVKKVDVAGGYVNFILDWPKLSSKILEEITRAGKNYGRGKKKNKKVMIEFCQANTHKAFHMGHVRNICIGESLSRIFEFAGYDVIRVNYQGDIGPHVAKCIWGFLKLYNGKPPEDVDKGKWLGDVYAKANKVARENPDIQKEISEINQKIYAKDKEIYKVWETTRGWCLKYFDKIYKDFGIKFDRLYFESEVEKIGTEVAKSLLKKGIARLSEGTILVDLEKYGLGVFLLVKSDGTPLYSAKDLGLSMLKSKEYGNIDISIHVVGSEQRLYFQQLFKTFELMGSPLAKKSYHLAYELVNLPTGKMSSREGNVILYEDVEKELEKHALEETKKRNPKMPEEKLDGISRKIAISALMYDMVKVSPNKSIIFDLKKALELEGNAAPYLQYTYVRAKSILEKAGKAEKTSGYAYDNVHEYRLIRSIARFPEIVERAANDMRPHYIANFAFEISDRFNEFYQFVNVIKSGEAEKWARLNLVKSFMIVLKNSLDILGIYIPERM